MKEYLYAILFLVALAGCSSDSDITGEDGDDEDTDDTENVINLPDEEDLVENFSFSTTVTISFSGSSATVSNLPEGVTVQQNGADVVVTSTKEGVEYSLSGTTSSGMFKIYSDYKFRLNLNGVNITNTDGPAINIQSKKRAFVVLTDGATNKLADGATYASSDEDMKGCLFSEGQLIISGGGSLSIQGNYKHGISSDDYIRTRGNCSVSITGAATDGIHVNDYVLIDNGTISVVSTADGIQCEQGAIEVNSGIITVKSGDDGLVANYDGSNSSANPFVKISGGTLTITTTGAAAKGINSSGNVDITGGKINITTSGNAVYANADISSAAGIKCDKNVTVSNAATSLTISSSGTAGKGINCDGEVVLNDGTITITTTGKQYTVSNQLDSSAKGIKNEGNLTINGGTINVKTTGGEGSEGIESKNILTINNGTIEVTAYDDCINAAKSLVVNGGKTYCYATNNDGFDSNGPMTITGGICIGCGTQSPEEGFDCDQNTFKITGGVVIGTGGATSTPSSSSTQRSVIYGTSATANQLINIQNSAGTSILTYVLPRTLSSMTFLFSSPDLVSGSYTINKGGSVSGGSSFHGYYTGASYSGGTQATSFTASSIVTNLGGSGGGGGGGGR